MELDLDKDEEIQLDNSDSSGEKLLTEEYQAVAGSAKSKKRVSIIWIKLRRLSLKNVEFPLYY